MTKNRFAASCGCGRRVPKGKGTLSLVDDAWAVSCAPCAASGATPRRPGAAAPARRGRVAAKAAGTRPSKARRAGRGGIRKAGSARRTKPVWREAPVIDPSLVFTALSWGTSTTLPGFGAVQCTPEFARVEADRAAATGARRKADELELLVTLVELAALGHSSHAFA